MKPLIRLTLGPVSQQGIETLLMSLRQLDKLYPECDVVVCANQLDNIHKIKHPIINQQEYINSLSYPPKEGYNVHWKLYPPRLREGSHEIFIDNDIILFKRLPEIDLFLSSDSTLLYEGLHGLHGNYEVPIKINSGIFGMPPGFRLFLEKNWENPFDEQGFVGSSLIKYHEYHVIKQTTIPILEPWMTDKSVFSALGVHFVGVNRYFHPGWEWYKSYRLL